jgi:catechol 2,3-dioxygenase-like lactoylglutathione lyase family enzyme
MFLGHIEIFVSNPLEAKSFYQDVLGFELVTVQGNQFVWLKSGHLEILLRPGRNHAPSPDYQSAPITLVLYTDDLTATVGDLEARGLVFKGFDGGDNCRTFTDPDGNWFQLADPNH